MSLGDEPSTHPRDEDERETYADVQARAEQFREMGFFKREASVEKAKPIKFKKSIDIDAVLFTCPEGVMPDPSLHASEATPDDLRKACEAVGLAVVERAEFESFDDARIHVAQARRERDTEKARAEKATGAYKGVLAELRRHLSCDWHVEDLLGAVRDIVGQCKAAEKAVTANRERAEKAEGELKATRAVYADALSRAEKAEIRAQENAQAAADRQRERDEVEIRERGLYRTIVDVREAVASTDADVAGAARAWRDSASKAVAEIDRIAEAANAAGWNGTENPKMVWDFITHLAEERDDLRTKLAAAESSLGLRVQVGDITVLNSGDATKVDALHARIRELESRLSALTAPVDGEPSDDKLAMEWNAGIFDGGDTLVAGRRALYRLGVQHERARNAPVAVDGEPTGEEMEKRWHDETTWRALAFALEQWRAGWSNSAPKPKPEDTPPATRRRWQRS